MNRPGSTRLMLMGAVLTLLSVGCGPNGDAGTATEPTMATTTTPISTTSTAASTEFSAELNITIGTADQPAEFRAALRCGTDADGTGYLADTASTTCDYLRTSSEAQLLLSKGPATNRACTEIYGGGEIADISGTLAGMPVGVMIDRANGCGIADWDLLQPILVEPYDLTRQSAAAECSGTGAPTDDEADQGDLPTPVADFRITLLDGAAACDLDGLADRAIADGTNVSFGGSDDPAQLWRDLESHDGTPMADLITVLRMAPGITDDGQGTIFYVWPAVAALNDWNDATAEQRSELAELFGADALDDWDLFGGYIGYRVGITDSGRWAFFVQGD